MSTLPKSPEKKIISLTVIGRDRTGVIAAFTNLLFMQGANIEALAEEVRRGQFSMTLEASWPTARFQPATVGEAISKLSADLKMETTWRILSSHRRQRMAILVTNESHCIEALLKSRLPSEATVVIGNQTSLRELAEKHKLPFVHIPWTERATAEKKLTEVLQQYEVDFIVLARFMRILSPNFVWRWKNKIINIHPSLLPAFQGASAYRQAFEKGVRVGGVTAHLVTPNLDDGPILDQGVFRITPRMTLAQIVAKGQTLEAKVLVSAVKLFLQYRFDIYWGKIHLDNIAR